MDFKEISRPVSGNTFCCQPGTAFCDCFTADRNLLAWAARHESMPRMTAGQRKECLDFLTKGGQCPHEGKPDHELAQAMLDAASALSTAAAANAPKTVDALAA